MKYLLIGEETERLYFRLVQDLDFNSWIDLFTEGGDAARFLAMDKIETPQKQCEAWFTKLKERYTNDLGGMNALIDKASDKIVGQCGLLVQEVDNNTELEIGYSILPEYWNQGYAAEAAEKCRDFAFENNFSDYLISIVHVENIKSEKVAKKNSMKLWKTTTFKEIPVNIFRITRAEWEQIK